MLFVYHALVVLHLVGWAIVLGGWFATLRSPGVYKGTLHGALTALVTGVAMVGIASAGLVDRHPDNIKMAVKLLIALIVCILAVVANKRGDKVSPLVKNGIGGLTLVNIVVAVFWQ